VSLQPKFRKLYDQKIALLPNVVGKMNLSSNVSMVPEESNSNDLKEMKRIISEDHSLVVTTVCGFIATFSFFGNLLLCVVILKRRSMLTKPYNVLIFNLAVTDMLTGEFCLNHSSFLP